MTDMITGTCASCGAPNFGTRYCETCGADQETQSSSPSALPAVKNVTYLRAASAIGLVLIVGLPALVADIASFAHAYAFETVGAPVLAVILVIATAAAACVAAYRSLPSGGVRLASILVAGIGGGLEAILAGLLGSTSYSDWLFGICLFVSWALSARFRGFCYFGLGIGLVASWLLFATQFSLSDTVFSALGPIGYDVLGMVFEAVGVLAAIGSAVGFERVQARRAANPRPATSRYGYTASPSGYSTQAPLQPMYAAGSSSPTDVVPVLYQPPPGYGPGVYAQRTNGFAVAALILGLLGISLLAIIFGHVAIGQIRRSGERGSGLAVTGLVFGYLWIAGSVIYVIAISAAVSSLGY